MIGIQSVPVIADAILKNVKGFNYERAYQAMKASMMSDYKGLSYVTNLEYIPADKENESRLLKVWICYCRLGSGTSSPEVG